MSNALPAQLQFLTQPVRDAREPITAPWLRSLLGAHVWHCEFGAAKREINFAVELDDGGLLTEPANHWLLLQFQKFLCLQTSSLLIGGRALGSRAQAERVIRATHIVDYWLLSAKHLRLAENGLLNFDANEVRLLTSLLSRGKWIQRAIYDPARVIREHLRRRLDELSELERQVLLDDAQALTLRRAAMGEKPAVVPLLGPEALEGGVLGMSLNELNVARRLLYSDGLYRWIKGTNHYDLEVSQLVRASYAHRTLNALPKFDLIEIPELEWAPSETRRTELPRAPVHTNAHDERAGDEYFKAYLSTLGSLRWFTHRPSPMVSPEALDAVDHLSNLAPTSFKEKGRFKLIPFEVTQFLLRKSMDFMYTHGESIVDCTLDVLIHADTTRIRSFKQLRALNIGAWTIRQPRREEGYFLALRQSPGLYQAFCILLGAINLCVETVMARRTDELVSLAHGCIGTNDSGEYVLLNTAGKRGLGEVSEQSQKPMPPLAAHAIGLLERLRTGAISAGVRVDELLVILPSSRSPEDREAKFVKASRVNLMECVDLMCDYFQSPCDQDGRRYYVRNHQLRRSFGFQFIWCGFFGGLDVLGWFFGHGGKRGTARYFTELISGDAIALKAKIASKAVREGLAAAHGLAEFISTKHGVTVDALSILDEDAVSEWMEAALDDGALDITVEFFKGPHGEDYRSLILVKGRT